MRTTNYMIISRDDHHAHLQNRFTIVSNTSTGPVLPRMVNGWPENRWYRQPQIAPDKRLSIAA